MPEGQPLVISILRKELDLVVAEEFARLLEPASDAPNVVIDLSRVEFIDSSCLGKLAALRRKRCALPGGGEGRLVVPSASVRRVLHIVGFDQQWQIFGSLEDAVDDFDGAQFA